MADDFLSLSKKNIIYSIVGIFSGMLVNQIGVQLYRVFNVTDQNTRVVVQIMLCCIIFAFIQTRVNQEFALEWQNITPGIFFTTFFFGVQYLSFTIEEGVYGILPLKSRTLSHSKEDTTATRQPQRSKLGI